MLSAKCQVLSVVTNEDKPAGRHLKLTPNPVKVMAQKYNIPVHTSHLIPLLNSGEGKPQQGEVVGIVAAYGQIIKQEVLDSFGGQMYNIHPSLLPKYRGPSPLQQQILDGVIETGVTIIKMDSQMDHGPIVGTACDTIRPDDTTITLGNRLFEMGADWLINSPLSPLLNQERGTRQREVSYTPQNHNEATYTKKLTKQDGFVKYEELASRSQEIERKKRAFTPWPGTWSINSKGERIKL